MNNSPWSCGPLNPSASSFCISHPPAPLQSVSALSLALVFLVMAPAGGQSSPPESSEVVHSGWAIPLERLPKVVRQTLEPMLIDQPGLTPMLLSMVVYELEIELSNGLERELFVDAIGREILVFEVMDGMEDEEREAEGSMDLAELPFPVQKTLLELWPGPFTEIEFEAEWGVGVIAAEWESGGQEFDAKILPDGELLSVQIPLPERLPAPVLDKARELGLKARDVEALSVRAYTLADRNSGRFVGPYVLATGRILDRSKLQF